LRLYHSSCPEGLAKATINCHDSPSSVRDMTQGPYDCETGIPTRSATAFSNNSLPSFFVACIKVHMLNWPVQMNVTKAHGGKYGDKARFVGPNTSLISMEVFQASDLCAVSSIGWTCVTLEVARSRIEAVVK
jgi:hypothetical protein